MQAHFNIYCLDSFTQDVAEITRALEGTLLEFHPGPMGTNVQGEWNEVMAAIRNCHQDLIRKHRRVLTTIVIEDDDQPISFANSIQQEVQSCRASS